LSTSKTYNVLTAPSIQPLNLSYCNFETPKLIGTQTSDIHQFNWYNSDGSFIKKSASVDLARNITGTFNYQYETINDLGCKSLTKQDATVSIITNNCDDRLNWIETIAYDDETTIISDSKSYFDLTGKGIQTQSRTFEKPLIFASQTLQDKYGRDVLSTLPAPTLKDDFHYDHYFVRSSPTSLYSTNDFDTETTKTNPSPVNHETQGTLGWYYSSNNNLETNVPTTDFPYSRSEFYDDGTGEVRKSAGAGDEHRMGKGHETLSGTFPVYNELDHYLLVRRAADKVNLPDNLAGVNSLKNNGVLSIGRDQNGKYALSITDKSGKTVMSALSGTTDDNLLSVSNAVTINNESGTPAYGTTIYFYILEPQAIEITVDRYKVVEIQRDPTPAFIAEDIINNVKKYPGQTFADASDPEKKWPAGYYRITLIGFNGYAYNSITAKFNHYFKDVSYQFYDDAGRLKCSISPNGFQQLKQPVPVPFNKIDKTTYTYNHQGWLLSMTEPDAGTTNYVYRKDGKIRFSQNAEQLIKNTFSYTHYDKLGRPIESGEYTGTDISFVAMNDADFVTSAMKIQLEQTYDEVTWTGVRKDWVRTHYDFPYERSGDETMVLTQDFLRGAVSWSENENIKTIYSYDEFGRVTWMAQRPTGMSRIFRADYTYSFLGNVKVVANLSYDLSGTLIDRFYHHYEYDKDQRLKTSHTSIDGSTKKLRASYFYYLHGPLKRIELGDRLQGIDFVYDIHGALRSINNPDNSKDPGKDGLTGVNSDVKPDVFGMVLDYYESDLPGLITSASADPMKYHKLFNEQQLLANNQSVSKGMFSQFNEPFFQASLFKQYSAENTLHEIKSNEELQSNHE
jgi:hypothetical protein